MKEASLCQLRPRTQAVQKWIKMDPNDYQQVKIISNPIKALSCTSEFSMQMQVNECRVFKDLLNLSQGVWTVAIDSITVLNIAKSPINAIFDVHTNLISSYKEVQNVAVTTNGWLASFELKCQPGDYQHLATPKHTFFTVTSRPMDTFRIYFKLHEFMAPQKYKLRVEIRMLFQRLL